MNGHLNIIEIYASVQGEAAYVGYPCVFVRLAGCPLRCRWCDTVYSFGEGERKSFEEILETIARDNIPLVELTGGEPLAQEASIAFMDLLVERGYKVLIETSGAHDISKIHRDVHIIMDIKCPDSRMSERNLWSNIAHLKASDEVKFVIASRADFDWAKDICQEHQLFTRCQVLFSAAFGLVKEAELVSWILADQLPVRLNMQIHKYIWSPRAKGV